MTPPLTDAELRAIRERCDNATPGPWSWLDSYRLEDGLGDATRTVWNRAFIAAARTDIPRLLAEVERLRDIEDERDQLQAQLWHQQELPESDA